MHRRTSVMERPIKRQGLKRGKNWSKLCNLRGWVSTLALILEGDM